MSLCGSERHIGRYCSCLGLFWQSHQDFQDLSGPGYDHVLFHAKDLDHLGRVGFDMLQYYTVTCEDIDKDEFRYRKLIVEPLVYERDLKEKSQNEKN